MTLSNFDKAKENIEDHLEFIFPLDSIPEKRTRDWVFNVSCLHYLGINTDWCTLL